MVTSDPKMLAFEISLKQLLILLNRAEHLGVISACAAKAPPFPDGISNCLLELLNNLLKQRYRVEVITGLGDAWQHCRLN